MTLRIADCGLRGEYGAVDGLPRILRLQIARYVKSNAGKS
jgi:hypothetical protein